MTDVLSSSAEQNLQIAALLDAALAMTNAIGHFACGAHIAQALWVLDPMRPIALPPIDFAP